MIGCLYCVTDKPRSNFTHLIHVLRGDHAEGDRRIAVLQNIIQTELLGGPT